jgi:hypothetical protein
VSSLLARADFPNGSYPQVWRPDLAKRERPAPFSAGQLITELWRVQSRGGGAPPLSQADALRLRLRRGGFDLESLAETLALIDRAIENALGTRLEERHLGAVHAILQGQIVELSGRHDRLLALVAAAVALALLGVPAHVLTAREEAAARVAGLLKPVATRLGVTSGLLTPEADDTTRKTVYRRDVAVAAVRHVAFDALRDRLGQGRGSGRLGAEYAAIREDATAGSLLRGLHFALLDDADDILLEEAVTPLFLSRPGRGRQRESGVQALRLAEVLDDHEDFELDPVSARVELTEAGRMRLAQLASPLGGLWQGMERREEMVELALAASRALRSGRDYRIQGGSLLLDGARVAAAFGPQEQRVLLELIRLKEGCAPSDEREPVARTTLAAFLKRYPRCGGVAALATRDAREFRRLHGLRVARVVAGATVAGGALVFPNGASHWRALAERVDVLAADGTVLVVVAPAEIAETRARLKAWGCRAVGADLARCVPATEIRDDDSLAEGSDGPVSVVVVGRFDPPRLADCLMRDLTRAGALRVERFQSCDEPGLLGPLAKSVLHLWPGTGALPSVMARAIVASATWRARRHAADRRRRIIAADEHQARLLGFAGSE